jgi:serine/threonine protein kinase
MERPTSSTSAGDGSPSSDDAASLAPILRIGRYDVLGRLAVGGMSELFFAHERVAGETLRRVVIKLLAAPEKSVLNGAAWMALFEREGRVSARLDHPNVCHVYEFGHVGAHCFIAMEWVQGISLRELLVHLRDSEARLPCSVAVNICAQVAAALEHARTATNAHDERLSVVHRDVNPANIMIRHDGVVKLVDFGVAQVEEQRACPTNRHIQGKLAYMAPEQLRGEELDHRADIFALGICLYELLTGARLYRRATPDAVREAVLDGAVPELRAACADIPEDLDAIVERALQKSPADRYQTAGELQAALEEHLVKRGAVASARPLAAFMAQHLGERRSVPPLERDEAVRTRLVSLLSPAPQASKSVPPAHPAVRRDAARDLPTLRVVLAPKPRALPLDGSRGARMRSGAVLAAFTATAGAWAVLRLVQAPQPAPALAAFVPRAAVASFASPAAEIAAGIAPAPAVQSLVESVSLAPPSLPVAARHVAPVVTAPAPKRPSAKRPRPDTTFIRDPGF